MKGILSEILFFLEKYYIEIILIVLFFVDAYSFYIDSSIGLEVEKRFSFFFRGLIEVILLIVIYLKRAYNKQSLYFLIVLLFPIFWLTIEYLNNENHNITISQVFQILKETNKYVFPIILFWVFRLSQSKYFLKIFEFLYLTSAVLVISAFITGNSFFYTYGQERFGFKPMIAAHNEVTLFWIIGVVYQIDKIRNTFSLFNLFSLLFIVVASILLGTKAIILFYLFLCIWGIFRLVEVAVIYKWLFIVSIVGLLMIFLIKTGIFSFFEEIYHAKGIVYALSSMRSEILVGRVLDTISNWQWYNYIIGGYFFKLPIAEMDLVDLFIFYGGLGVVLYFRLIFKTIFSFSSDNKLAWFFVSQFIIIGGLAGHFFSSGTNAAYLAVLCYHWQDKRKVII